MKNMKVSAKLIVSFLFVVALAVIIGAVGILGMYNMNVGDDELYNGNYLPSIQAGNISQLVVEQRVYLRNYVIYDVNLDASTFSSTKASMEESKTNMENLLKEYDETIVLPEDRAIYNELVDVYYKEWVPMMLGVYEMGLANRTEEAKIALTEATDLAGKMNELTTELQSINLADGEATVQSNTSMFYTMTIIEVVVLVAAIAISMFLAFYISGLIAKPVSFMKDILLRIGTQGDMKFTDAEYHQIEEYAKTKDEVGASVDMLQTMVRRLVRVGDALQIVANGDLTNDLALLSERDTMGLSLQKMTASLNDMFHEIYVSTAQVSSGSKQIADGSQALAQGSTEQAAAVEQLSSSIAEIADKTKTNATMATKAATLAETIKNNAEKGNRQMDEMMSAVKDINQASQNINKVIKVIDDIAFQTNILALNAAVEAARAGQHGKGFAVVAEEVRSLAAKSAEAASETGSLIANSIEKAELGGQIANETAASLADIVSGINESSVIVGEIAKSSEEQALGISQINKGIDQVAQVVQQNSATAEESAAASEEMSGQSNMLEELITQFKLKDDNHKPRQLPPQEPKAKKLSMPAKSTSYVANESDYGKY